MMNLGETVSFGIEISNADPLVPLKRMERFVVGQLGQSLDGRIATHTGHSKYINHESGLRHLHGLRAAVDAVVVGVGTVNEDNPQLTVRLCEGKSPVRVIIDPNGRVFTKSTLFSDDGPPVLIITRKETSFSSDLSCDIMRLNEIDGRLQPDDILDALAERGMRRVLIEGGNRTLSSFLNAECLDRLHLITAPMLLGSGYSGINLSPVCEVGAGLKPKVTMHHLGHDILFDCDFRSES